MNPGPSLNYRADRQPLVAAGQIDCHAQDMTATIAADLTLAQVQDRLAELEQWLPADGPPDRSVGQLVEENSTGPLRLGYGAWRDLLLGCQFRAGDQRLISAGGRTVKNVAGYDLTKFMVGQRGVFGKLVTITTRTYRRPGGALLAGVDASDSGIGSMIATALKPRWAILDPEALWCGYLDEPPALEFFARKLKEDRGAVAQTRSLEQDIADRLARWNVEGDQFRASVPPARILAFVKLAGLSKWVADAAYGVVRGTWANQDRAAVQSAAQSVGGTVNFWIGGQLHWRPGAAQAAILQRLKKAFDPDGRLATLPAELP